MPWGSAYSVGWKMDFYRLEGAPSLRKKAGECYGPGLYELLRSAQPTTANGGFLFSCALLNDHCLAGVSRFYGGVYHARVVAQSAYSTVHGVAVFHHEKVVTAATLGHVAVVGVGSGVEVVMAGLGDHPVWHPVADPLEEHLVVSCGNAAHGLALDHPSDPLEKGTVSALAPPLGVTVSHINSSTWGATHPQLRRSFLALFTDLRRIGILRSWRRKLH